MNKIYNEDCLITAKSIKINSIDLIVADPPYNNCVNEEWDKSWDSEETYLLWLNERIISWFDLLSDKGNLLMYCKRQFEHKLKTFMDAYGFEQRTIIWMRKRQFSQTRGKTLNSGYEPIIWYSKSKNFIFNNIKIEPEQHLSKRKEYTKGILSEGVSLSDAWIDIPALSHNAKEKTKHKTQKPIKLSSRLVEVFSNQDSSVYIPFAGSGSEIESCIKLKRNWIASETNLDYIENIISPRISIYL